MAAGCCDPIVVTMKNHLLHAPLLVAGLLAACDAPSTTMDGSLPGIDGGPVEARDTGRVETSDAPVDVAANDAGPPDCNGRHRRVSILGTGFGTKMGTPYFDHFECHPVGALSAGRTGEMNLSSAGGTSIATDAQHGVGLQSYRHDYNAVDFPKVFITYPERTQRAYFAGYFRFSGTGGPRNVWKFLRFGNGEVYYANRFADEYTSHGLARPESLSATLYTEEGEYVEYAGTSEVPSRSDLFTQDAWHFYEAEIDAGTVGGNDCFVEVRLDGVPTVRFSGSSLRTPLHPELLSYVLTPITGLDGEVRDIRMWLDDVYTDGDRARVVMTDNATYASSTQWAVQPVVSWSNESIVIEPHRGAFAVGARAHLHVFNASGVHVFTMPTTVEAD